RWSARVVLFVEVLLFIVLVILWVPARRPARLGARDVEPDHALVPVADRELGYLQRPGCRPHRRKQGIYPDSPAPPGLAGAAVAETLQHRLDHFVQAQPTLGVQLGREPDLSVDH